MNWITLAFRNLLRNTRRSINTVAAVALGFAAVNIFAGFSDYMFLSIRQAYIYDQANCHVQIWRNDGRIYGGTDPANYLLSAEEYASIQTFANHDDRIQLAAGMLEVRGNVDLDGAQSFFLGRALVPSVQELIRERATAVRGKNKNPYTGRPITDDTPSGIGMSEGMQKQFGIEIGDEIILMGPDVTGQLNAIPAEVHQFMGLASKVLNSSFIYMTLELAHAFYSTDGVSCARILLYDGDLTDQVAADLREHFSDREWEILTWYEASDVYESTKRVFDIIFGLVFVIIFTIVTASVVNTTGMAVVERTKEIGTLRAIGLKRPGVVVLFAIESALLGIIGSMVGLLFTIFLSLTIDGIKPTWQPPMTTRPIIWQIHLVPAYLSLSFLVIVIFTALAAIRPAQRASKQSIVDALGHV